MAPVHLRPCLDLHKGSVVRSTCVRCLRVIPYIATTIILVGLGYHSLKVDSTDIRIYIFGLAANPRVARRSNYVGRK